MLLIFTEIFQKFSIPQFQNVALDFFKSNKKNAAKRSLLELFN